MSGRYWFNPDLLRCHIIMRLQFSKQKIFDTDHHRKNTPAWESSLHWHNQGQSINALVRQDSLQSNIRLWWTYMHCIEVSHRLPGTYKKDNSTMLVLDVLPYSNSSWKLVFLVSLPNAKPSPEHGLYINKVPESCMYKSWYQWSPQF